MRATGSTVEFVRNYMESQSHSIALLLKGIRIAMIPFLSVWPAVRCLSGEGDRAMQTRSWDDLLGGPYSEMRDARNRFGERSVGFWRVWSQERMEYRNSGLAMWEKSSDDPRRYIWLLRTLETPPYYWTDLDQGAETLQRGKLTAAIDRRAYSEWRSRYAIMRAQFLSDSRVAEAFPGAKVETLREQLLAAEWRERFLIELAIDGRDPGEMLIQLLDFTETHAESPWIREVVHEFVKCTDQSVNVEKEFLTVLSRSRHRVIAEFANGLLNRTRLRESPLELALGTLEGGTVDIASMRGKVVLVTWWNNGCGYCIRAMPELQRVYQKYRSRGFEIVGVWSSWDGTDEKTNIDEALAHLKRTSATWPNGILSGTERNRVWQFYSIVGFPVYWLLDRDGRLVTSQLSGEKLEEEVVKLLK